jgi:sugar phosphate isomerase/epimerase
MHRRVFLQTGMEAMLAMAAAQVGAAQTPAAGSIKKLKVDAYSRHLQWLRTADQVAEAVVEMGFDGVDLTVRPYPGHVDPEKVAQELPLFVKTLREHGLQVVTITCPITDTDSPNAERILETASSLGITHYWWGTFRYEQGKPVMPQLEALKPRVAKLAALNAKYKMTAMYHTYSGGGTVGAAIWDLLHVLKEFDPKQVGFHYDIGHMTNAGGNGTWALNMRAAGPYIAGISAKDSQFEPTFAASGGGPLTPEMATVAASSGRRGGGTPGWRVRQVPLGTGMIDLPQVASILKEIGFSGPIEIQAEYPNGGAESAQDKITLPRQLVLGAMKRDLLALKMSFGPSGLL